MLNMNLQARYQVRIAGHRSRLLFTCQSKATAEKMAAASGHATRIFLVKVPV